MSSFHYLESSEKGQISEIQPRQRPSLDLSRTGSHDEPIAHVEDRETSNELSFADIEKMKVTQNRLNSLFNTFRDHIDRSYPDKAKPGKNGFTTTEKGQIPLTREELQEKYNEAIKHLKYRFSDKSIRYILKHPDTNEEDINALADVTTYLLIREENSETDGKGKDTKKGVFRIKDEDISQLWVGAREMFAKEKRYRNNEKKAHATIEYIEREMKRRGLTTMLRTLVPGRKRILKMHISIEHGQAEGRLKHIEANHKKSKKPPLKSRPEEANTTSDSEKQPSQKANTTSDSEKQPSQKANEITVQEVVSETSKTPYPDQKAKRERDTRLGNVERTDLHGRRGKEQRIYRQIIDKQKKFEDAQTEFRWLRARNNLAFDRVYYHVSTLIDDYTEECSKTDDISLFEHIKITQARDSLNLFMQHINTKKVEGIQFTLDTEFARAEQALEDAKADLKRTIKKHGNSGLGTTLNNYASDVGFVFTTAGLLVTVIPLASGG